MNTVLSYPISVNIATQQPRPQVLLTFNVMPLNVMTLPPVFSPATPLSQTANHTLMFSRPQSPLIMFQIMCLTNLFTLVPTSITLVQVKVVGMGMDLAHNLNFAINLGILFTDVINALTPTLLE